MVSPRTKSENETTKKEENIENETHKQAYTECTHNITQASRAPLTGPVIILLEINKFTASASLNTYNRINVYLGFARAGEQSDSRARARACVARIRLRDMSCPILQCHKHCASILCGDSIVSLCRRDRSILFAPAFSTCTLFSLRSLMCCSCLNVFIRRVFLLLRFLFFFHRLWTTERFYAAQNKCEFNRFDYTFVSYDTILLYVQLFTLHTPPWSGYTGRVLHLAYLIIPVMPASTCKYAASTWYAFVCNILAILDQYGIQCLIAQCEWMRHTKRCRKCVSKSERQSQVTTQHTELTIGRMVVRCISHWIVSHWYLDEAIGVKEKRNKLKEKKKKKMQRRNEKHAGAKKTTTANEKNYRWTYMELARWRMQKRIGQKESTNIFHKN